MMSVAKSILPLVAGIAVLGLLPAVLAHGDEMDTGMDMKPVTVDAPAPETTEYPPTYFAYPDHKVVIYAHIAIMVLAWVFMLPVAVMFSLARSRYTLLSQFVFIAANAFGVLLSTIYNASTPDLYPNNAHHSLGWVATWVVCAQVVVGLLGRIAGALSAKSGSGVRSDERRSFIPVSTEAMAEHESQFPKPYRLSNDSGQGTERNTESLRSHSLSSASGAFSPTFPPPREPEKEYVEDDEDDEDLEAHIPAGSRAGAVQSLAKKVAGMVSSRAWKVLIFGYNFVDRTILILGFMALCTGMITFARFFEGRQIFTGLAHWIKGGVFFWLGILTLGRWAGCFGELGWAWNVRPKQAGQKWRPSSEFVESALIFFYGGTNIFLEHLGNAGKEFSHEDLEHISITVLFLGGGLCGMLIESTNIRELLNTSVVESTQAGPGHEYRDEEERAELREPKTYSFSMNPIPALVILLLGISMSSHTQQSMVSSMVHKQWGNLLSGAAFARFLTYVLVYLKPPTSIYPSRPPTELLTSFGLMTGGLIFMASSGDTIIGMTHYNLDAMFVFTVTMGLMGLLMAWVLLMVALKGWATRKELNRSTGFQRSL